MSVRDVHFSHSPMFCLSGVPLCGQGPWWIRQTPSGLGQCLALTKIKTIITQKIRVGSSPALSLMCLLIWLRVNTYGTGSIKVRIGFKDAELWKNSLASPFDSWNSHFGIDPGWSGAAFASLPGRLAGRGSGKTVICRQNILAWYQKTRILLLMPSVTWGKSHTHTQPDKLNPNKGKQIHRSRSVTGKVTPDSRWIQTIKRWFWKQFHVNTLQIVTEMDAFLGNSKLDTRKRPK